MALDFPDKEKALAFVSPLCGLIKWVKIGLQLFIAAGPDFIESVKKMGFNIFLDLKFYDIPNTVANAVISAGEIGADMLTLHLQGGERMCTAARAALGGKNNPLLMGVTVLTSFAAGEMPGIDREPGEFAEELAEKATAWQMDGIICSGAEVAKIKARDPGLLCVCPGIRSGNEKHDDQRRVFTPDQAVAAGADFLVMGRPILLAEKPETVISDIYKRIEAGN